MSPSHTRKEDRLYHYCFRQDALKRGPDACPVGRMPAGEIEAAVIDQLRGIFRQPEIVVGTCRAARAEADDITEVEVRARSLSSTRCGTSCSRPSRRGSLGCWSSGSTCGCAAWRFGYGRTGSRDW